jgi:hypothetical protein
MSCEYSSIHDYPCVPGVIIFDLDPHPINCPNCPTNCRDPRMINAKPSDRERDKNLIKQKLKSGLGVDSISGFPSLYRINHPNFVMIPSLH